MRAIALAHEGDVMLDSAVGRGSTFSVRLPAVVTTHETEQSWHLS
ncbi:signal transduction histidine kinase [Mycolicibacterium iranicum]|uniref:Signal transduction histidine kinase n=1 Tax=Mycolicibacterium iranicum TaxID=912594 RepID=A0A839Q3Y4_MYCIR|nr:ATP-binding protein [Mycolicibacterium iranicum]MBB2990153.1 signal transduction histidine kinase [Mycolicibacterium iranicum]